MSDEQDSWLGKFGVKIVRAAKDVAEGDLDAAAGAGAKLVSVAAGAAAGAADAFGQADTAQELRGAQAAAQADSDRYIGDAKRDFGDAGAQFGWQPPGFPLPPPTERPDPPPSGGPPTERNPPPTERPDPPPSGGPPTERGFAPTQAAGLSGNDIDLDRAADVTETAAVVGGVVVGQALVDRAGLNPMGAVGSALTPLGAVTDVVSAETSSIDVSAQLARDIQGLKDGSLTSGAPVADKAAAAQEPVAEEADDN